MDDADKYRGLSYTPGPRSDGAEPVSAYRGSSASPFTDRLASQRAAITGQPAALSRPQSMVRDALNTPGCPHRALAQIADDDLAVARQLLADAMEARRE